MSPVFDGKKYRALQESLETNEERLSQLDESLRIDSAFYTKDNEVKRVLNKPHTFFKNEIIKACKGIFDIKADSYCTSGIPFVRIANLKNMQIDTSDMAYIPAGIHQAYESSSLSYGDIVLSKTAIPAASVVSIPECNTSQDIIAIRLKKDASIQSFFTVVYLNTWYGLAFMEKLFTGNIQKHFNLSDCKEKLPVPVFSVSFQRQIGSLLEKSIVCRKKAEETYLLSEKRLLQELGLTDWHPVDESIAEKTYADFQESGRLDAEFFQPKYREIIRKLKQYKHGTVSCETVLKDAMTRLNQETEYCYIELADIGKNGEIKSCTRAPAEKLPSRARQRVKANDVIISSVEGSLSSCALVTEEYNNALCSTGFHVLRSSEINPETLLLLMKSWPVQALLKQGCSGTILTAILPDALKQINIPKIRYDVQQQLAANIKKSFALRKESNRMTDIAKRAVEVAIEQNEKAAMKLLEDGHNV
ncbi:MAG: hypothetical protein IKQ16_02565 [Lentisphaeria bacterium]|nr:hypothetical protein [Lentisphaeria bacterium]